MAATQTINSEPICNSDGSPCWSYRASFKNIWSKYDEETNQQIESAYLQNKKEVTLDKGPYFGKASNIGIYVVQFDKHTHVQLNTKTLFKRLIHRTVSNPDDTTSNNRNNKKPLNTDAGIYWCYNDELIWKPYDKETNKQIEDAYINHKESVTLTKGGFFSERPDVFVVIFNRETFPHICYQKNLNINWIRQIIRCRDELKPKEIQHNDDHKVDICNDKQYQEQIDTLQREKEELQHEKKEMELENMKLKQELIDIKLKHLDLDDYKTWRIQEIVHWIVHLEDDKYLKYEDELTMHLNKENVNGTCLQRIAKNDNDLYRWGITDYQDRANIMEKIKELIQVDNHIAEAATKTEGAPTAYI